MLQPASYGVLAGQLAWHVQCNDRSDAHTGI